MLDAERKRAKPLEAKRYQRRVEKIRQGMLISRLEKIALGEVEALPHQVTAALGLLKKVCPDLSAVEMQSEVRVTHETATPELLRARLLEAGLDPDRVQETLLQ